jgi:hypothetical protein
MAAPTAKATLIITIDDIAAPNSQSRPTSGSWLIPTPAYAAASA